MDFKKRLESLLHSRSENLQNYIKTLIANDLRGSLFPEDVLQEVVRYTLERADRFQDCDQEKLWGFLLWKSKMQVFQRARSLRKSFEKSATLDDSAEKLKEVSHLNFPSPSLLLHKSDKKLSVRHYISLLPSSEQKVALSLVRLQGLPLKDAGQVMGKTPDAVEKLVKRGFLQLVRIMKSQGASKYVTSGTTS